MLKFLENRGLVMNRTRKGGVLKIPLKDKKVLRYVTSLSGLKDFTEGKRHFIYFNPLGEEEK